MITVGVIFCANCGSQMVDVNSWNGPNEVIVECAECTHTALLSGFTLGKTHISPTTFKNAAKDAAVYHNNPEIGKMIRERAEEEIRNNNFD